MAISYPPSFGPQMHDLAMRYDAALQEAIHNPAKAADSINFFKDFASRQANDEFGQSLKGQALQYVDYLTIASGNRGGQKASPLPPGSVGGVIEGSKFGITTPAGKTLTTAEKKAQNPLYNPLYDPSSAEYKANLVKASNPNAPQIQNPTTPATIPKVQISSAATPKANNNLNSSTSNLLQAVQGQNAPVPSYSTPAAGPNLIAQPKIELPQMFQANFNAPSTTPPNAPNGITMPNWAGQKPKGGFGSNWNDLLSVAYNRQPR